MRLTSLRCHKRLPLRRHEDNRERDRRHQASRARGRLAWPELVRSRAAGLEDTSIEGIVTKLRVGKRTLPPPPELTLARGSRLPSLAGRRNFRGCILEARLSVKAIQWEHC